MENLQYNSRFQIFRFIFVGIINTSVDFLLLNILIIFVSIEDNESLYGILKGVSFMLAVINSYFLNKYWVFRGGSNPSIFKERVAFFAVSLIGFFINISVSTLIFIFVTKSFLFVSSLSANIGALCGSLAVLAWNFAGYKWLVFKK